MMLSSLLRLLKVNSSHPELFFFFFFIEQFITAIENVRFEIYLRFIWIQTYIFFYFSLRLFAEHHTVSFWCRKFSSRPKSRKNSDFIDFKAFVYFCHSEGSDKDEITFKMVEKHRYGLWKLYRNTLKETESYSLSYSKNSCAYHAPTESIGR